MIKFSKTLANLFSLLICSIFLLGVNGCSKENLNPSPDSSVSQEQAFKIQPSKGPGNPCGGETELQGTFVVTPNPAPGFDFGVRLFVTQASPPAGCQCISSSVSVSLQIPENFLENVALTTYGQNGAAVHNLYSDPFNRAIVGTNSDPAGFRFDFGLGDLVLIKLKDNVNYNSNVIANSVGGICVVDNIPDPNG